MNVNLISSQPQVYRMKQKAQKLKFTNAMVKKAANHGRLDVIQKRKIAEIMKLCSEFVTTPQLNFIMAQVNQGRKKAKGRRWTINDKRLCLSLLHSSPKTYRLLRTVFTLPSISTLKLLMRRVQIYPGINQPILDALKLKLANSPPLHKVVTLALDEMAIKEALSYDASQDAVEGFTMELTRGNTLANHANVFMLRGLVEKWKQPIGYYLSSGPMEGHTMAELVKSAIVKLQAVNIHPAVLVADQGSNNRNMVFQHLKVTVSKPYFLVGGQKVFVLFDPPHLLKCVRNNLKNHGFEVEGQDVLWSYVEEFFNRDSENHIRLAPRLTQKHISLPPFTPMRVYLATQVLSHSVAAGISCMVQWKIMPGYYISPLSHCIFLFIFLRNATSVYFILQ